MPNKIYENVYFEDFYDLYIFDMKLKQVTLSQIFDIESRLRTSIAYNFTSVYCRDKKDTMRYTDSNYYKMPDKADKHMINVFKSFDLFRKTLYMKNGYVKRKSFIDELKDGRNYVREYMYPPFWGVIKALPLGSLYYTFVFLNDIVKEKVLNDFGLKLSDAKAFEQAIYILKEVRNQCAHLELITRFRLKRIEKLNKFYDITIKANLSKGVLNYMDVVKIFKLFGNELKVKRIIVFFYAKMIIKGRKMIAEKAISKMGRKAIYQWIKL